jgi:predicted RNase H-like nuclease (RuvC/YqgF family)
MDTLAKLKERLDKLLEQYEKLEVRNEELRAENKDLRAKLIELEQEVSVLNADKARFEKQLGEKNEAAARRISRLVETIDQLQSEMEFS